jgi:hypothetical protein
MRPEDLAAAGPRSAARSGEVREAVAAVREGYELHYAGRGEDADLALLVGDRRYADGLAGLAALGDLPAIAELADVISLCAQAHAAGDADLAAAVWTAGTTAVGWGASPELVGAKARARSGQDGAGAALRQAARQLHGDVAQDHRATGAPDGSEP